MGFEGLDTRPAFSMVVVGLEGTRKVLTFELEGSHHGRIDVIAISQGYFSDCLAATSKSGRM